jgi:fucose permease
MFVLILKSQNSFFISGGLFIMWPSIFDLAIAGLGKNTKALS